MGQIFVVVLAFAPVFSRYLSLNAYWISLPHPVIRFSPNFIRFFPCYRFPLLLLLSFCFSCTSLLENQFSERAVKRSPLSMPIPPLLRAFFGFFSLLRHVFSNYPRSPLAQGVGIFLFFCFLGFFYVFLLQRIYIFFRLFYLLVFRDFVPLYIYGGSFPFDCRVCFPMRQYQTPPVNDGTRVMFAH